MTELFKVTDQNDDFVMVAPMGTLTWYFDLYQAAVERIIRETENKNTVCRVHFNGRNRHYEAVNVTRERTYR